MKPRMDSRINLQIDVKLRVLERTSEFNLSQDLALAVQRRVAWSDD